MTDTGITAELLDEIERKAKAATHGPWRVIENKGDPDRRIAHHGYTIGSPSKASIALCRNSHDPHTPAHIAFCGPETVLALVAEVRRLQTDALFHLRAAQWAMAQHESQEWPQE